MTDSNWLGHHAFWTGAAGLVGRRHLPKSQRVTVTVSVYPETLEIPSRPKKGSHNASAAELTRKKIETGTLAEEKLAGRKDDSKQKSEKSAHLSIG